MRDTNVCVFVCCLTFFLPTHRFPFLFFTFWSFLCPLLSLLRFDFATHRNFRKHLRMVGSRRLKAQSESDVCGWYVCSNWLWCSSPRHHKCFVFLFILACSRLCVWHQALLLLCWDLFFFFNQHIVSLWRLYIDQCVFDKSAIWLCMCIYVCVCLCAQYVLSSCSTLNVCFFGCFCRKAHTKINYILLKRQKMRQWVAVIEKCVFFFLKIVSGASLRRVCETNEILDSCDCNLSRNLIDWIDSSRVLLSFMILENMEVQRKHVQCALLKMVIFLFLSALINPCERSKLIQPSFLNENQRIFKVSVEAITKT